MNLADLLELASNSPSRTSARSGVSRMTLKRLRDESVTPSLPTLKELALALGYEMQIDFKPAGDADAAVAARLLIDHGDADTTPRPAVADWIGRFARYGLDSPEALVTEAGKLASPLHRRGARFFAPHFSMNRNQALLAVTSAGIDASPDRQYAVSGAPAAAAILGREIVGATLLSTVDVGAVSEALVTVFRESDKYQPAGIVIAPAPIEYFLDCQQVDGATFASPVQAVLDLHGLDMAAVAQEITEGW